MYLYGLSADRLNFHTDIDLSVLHYPSKICDVCMAFCTTNIKGMRTVCQRPLSGG